MLEHATRKGFIGGLGDKIQKNIEMEKGKHKKDLGPKNGIRCDYCKKGLKNTPPILTPLNISILFYPLKFLTQTGFRIHYTYI